MSHENKNETTNWGISGVPVALRCRVTAQAKRRGITTPALMQEWIERHLRSGKSVTPLKRLPKDARYWVLPQFPVLLRQEFIAQVIEQDVTVAAVLIPLIRAALAKED